jgi:hypothetical protein
LSPEEDYDAHTERVTAVAGATIEHFEVGEEVCVREREREANELRVGAVRGSVTWAHTPLRNKKMDSFSQ